MTQKLPCEWFTLGYVAKLCNRDISTIRRYACQGYIPAPQVKNSKGWSLYSFDEMKAIVLAFRKLDNKEITLNQLYDSAQVLLSESSIS